MTQITQAAAPVWHAQYEAVVGLSHRDSRYPLPCQDAVLAQVSSRPMLLVADGAGSSAVSEIGSQSVVTGLARLFQTLEYLLAELLDSDDASDEARTRQFALVIVKHARGILEDLSRAHRRALGDFRCTLSAVILGRKRLIWLKVGDSPLVLEHERQQAGASNESERKDRVLSTLGHNGKGEFANQTVFIDEKLQPDEVQFGLLPVHQLTGVAVMSDGAAERLVATDGSKASIQLSQWFAALRSDTFSRRALTRFFYSDDFTKGSSGDDCSVGMLSLMQTVG
ncbi:hypothetical protein A8C75_06715 [Marinobacterium aestuarii]|uniref:PPM-type phosphatase domain-containing protein n=1 Tax=Marinobacterium aestuarii TaxID=1821621 RepID=A0A1A9EVL9_9GAMM|nr:hypothetical protein A8C75_06715 [Marinobacterium aestuarii]